MHIQYRGDGPYLDVSVDDVSVTIGTMTFNLSERQDDSAVWIDLRRGESGLSENGEGRQLASVHVPPARYEEVDTGEKDDEGSAILKRHRILLDMSRVLLMLWTVK